MDGYDVISNPSEEEIAQVLKSHLLVRHRLREIDTEISAIPNPFEKEGWVTSIPDLDSKRNFKIADFKRIHKLRKEYRKLKEREEYNIRFLKLKQIDGVIHQLEELNKKSDGTE